MRSLGVLAVASASACNGLFGLHETRLADAAFHDAPADAPYTCPALGAVPSYGPQLFPTVSTFCSDFTYSSAADRVIGLCDFGGVLQLSEGSSVGALVAIPAFAFDGVHTYEMPRLAPAGDELFVRVLPSTTSTIARYTRATDGTWAFAANVDLAGLTITQMSAPTTGAIGRRVLVRDTTSALFELADQGGDTWSMVDTYTEQDFGIASSVQGPTWTADGLHVVFGLSSFSAGMNWTYYAGRTDLTSRFTAAQIVTTAPMDTPQFLEVGCGRLYFVHGGYLEYVQQP